MTLHYKHGLLGYHQKPGTRLSQLVRPLVWGATIAAAVATAAASIPYWQAGKVLKIDAWEDEYEVGPLGNEKDDLFSTISGMCANQVSIGKLGGPGDLYVDAIEKYNNVDSGRLRVGMTITVPSDAHREPITVMQALCGDKGSTPKTDRLCAFIDKHYR